MDVREKLDLVDRKKIYEVACKNCTRHGEEYGECYHDEPCEKLIFAFTTAEPVDSVEAVQEWISVKDKLPTIYDADADNCVLAIHKASNKRYYHWRSVADNPFDFTHWMKTPQPPKGE